VLQLASLQASDEWNTSSASSLSSLPLFASKNDASANGFSGDRARYDSDSSRRFFDSGLDSLDDRTESHGLATTALRRERLHFATNPSRCVFLVILFVCRCTDTVCVTIEGFGYREVVPTLIDGDTSEGTNGWPVFDPRFTAAMVAGFYDSQPETIGTNFVSPSSVRIRSDGLTSNSKQTASNRR